MPRAATAILTSAQADFGMARMYQGLTEDMPRQLEVFSDFDQAISWLRSDHQER